MLGVLTNGPIWGRQGTLRPDTSSSGGGHQRWMGWRSTEEAGPGPSPSCRRSIFFHSFNHSYFIQATFAGIFCRPELMLGPRDTRVTEPLATQHDPACCEDCHGQRRHRNFLRGQKEKQACQGTLELFLA